jgi:hypothetical protein
MKKCLIGLLVIGLAFCFLGSAKATTLWLNPSTQTVNTSTTVTVMLGISSVSSPGVDVMDIVLHFDTNLLDATGAYFGADYLPYWDQFMDIGEGFFSIGPELDNVNGEISFTMANLGTLGATGSGTIAVMTFVTDATNGGTAYLDYTSWLREPVTGNLTTPTGPGTENIVVQGGEGPVIPEPATMMLVAAGLAALGGYARKKRS